MITLNYITIRKDYIPVSVIISQTSFSLFYLSINLDKFHPTLEELREWYKKSGLPLKRFFNTSGLLYKSLNLKEKLPDMSEEEMLKLLSTDGMLVKRPILVTDTDVLVGFKEAEWQSVLQTEK